MPSPRFLRATLILALVGAAACSDDGGDEGSCSGDELYSEEQAFADAWATTLAKEDDGFAVPQDDADRLAPHIVVENGTAYCRRAGVQIGWHPKGADLFKKK